MCRYFVIVGFFCFTSLELRASSDHLQFKNPIQSFFDSLFLISHEVTNQVDPSLKSQDDIRERLQSLALDFLNLKYVPYVWGGKKIGSEQACKECRSCIQNNGVPYKQRLQRCQACRACGVDCSHLVNIVYGSVGLDYPYANTANLNLADTQKLEQNFGFVSISTESPLKVGDLILFRKHIVMVVNEDYESLDDVQVIHATPRRGQLQIGGIFSSKLGPIIRNRGNIMKVLRHGALKSLDDQRTPASPVT
jgi:hypothetical protein